MKKVARNLAIYLIAVTVIFAGAAAYILREAPWYFAAGAAGYAAAVNAIIWLCTAYSSIRRGVCLILGLAMIEAGFYFVYRLTTGGLRGIDDIIMMAISPVVGTAFLYYGVTGRTHKWVDRWITRRKRAMDDIATDPDGDDPTQQQHGPKGRR